MTTPKCKEIKKTDDFWKIKSYKDGLASQCRGCMSGHPIKPKEILPKGMKRCSKCREVKSISEYYKRKNGLSYLCKECHKNYQNECYTKTKNHMIF